MNAELKELERQRNEAQARISAIEEAENQRKSEALVGRYFKYRNSYGQGSNWWLYFKVVKADGRYVVGPKFEQRVGCGDELMAAADERAHNQMSGYTEIDAKEYVRARADFVSKLNAAILL